MWEIQQNAAKFGCSWSLVAALAACLCQPVAAVQDSVIVMWVRTSNWASRLGTGKKIYRSRLYAGVDAQGVSG